MYSVTIDIAPNNWPGDDHARLVAACAGFHARMPVTRIRMLLSDPGPPPVYEFRIDFLDGRVFKSSVTNDDPMNPLIDIGFNTNVFRSSEHGHVRDLRQVVSELLRAHPDLTQMRYQL